MSVSSSFDLPKFKAQFEAIRADIASRAPTLTEDIGISSEDLADEADLCATELQTTMWLRLRAREALYLKKVNQALERIARGTFGLCDRCDDPIEARRLEARPTATLCVSCKEHEERLEWLHIDGHRSKSLGHGRLRLA